METNPKRMASQNIRYLREKYGYSQQQISMFLGVNVRTYRRWENDESTIDVATFIKILSFYGYTLDVVNINRVGG